jgi:hypothetical protein
VHVQPAVSTAGFFALPCVNWAMPILNAPIEFEYEGIQFEGMFYTSKGNENAWQLLLYNRAYGQLIKYYNGWKWCPNAKGMFKEPYMKDFFVKTVEAYLNSLRIH